MNYESTIPIDKYIIDFTKNNMFKKEYN